MPQLAVSTENFHPYWVLTLTPVGFPVLARPSAVGFFSHDDCRARHAHCGRLAVDASCFAGCTRAWGGPAALAGLYENENYLISRHFCGKLAQFWLDIGFD